MTPRPICSALPLLALLCACSSASAPPEVEPFFDADATTTRSLLTLGFTPDQPNFSFDLGVSNDTIDRAGDRITVDGQGATLDDTGTTATFDTGGTVTFTDQGLDYVVTFRSSDDAYGITGILSTSLGDAASGSVSYTGTDNSEVNYRDGTSVAFLTGDATITADFDTMLVDVRIDNLDGVESGGVGSSPIDDAMVVTISGARIVGTQFAGGTATVTSDAGLPGVAGDGLHSGGFFGPDAAEVGGAFQLTTTSGFGSYYGWYLGD